MKFEEMTDSQLEEWHNLYNKYFNAYDCWDVGCYCQDELLFDAGDGGYDEFLVCDHLSSDECPMFEKWKLKDQKPLNSIKER